MVTTVFVYETVRRNLFGESKSSDLDVTDSGLSKLEETMSVCIYQTKSSLIDTERALGEVWKQELLQSIVATISAIRL